MSETCHPGIAYILQLYTEEQSRVDTALTHSVCHMSKEDGMRGMELPYQLRSDWMVTCVLFLCFIDIRRIAGVCAGQARTGTGRRPAG